MSIIGGVLPVCCDLGAWLNTPEPYANAYNGCGNFILLRTLTNRRRCDDSSLVRREISGTVVGSTNDAGNWCTDERLRFNFSLGDSNLDALL